MKFHLAIPSKDIVESLQYYAMLGCKIGRFNDDHGIIDFFGHQVVVHKVDIVVEQNSLYPRHFGLVLKEYEFEEIRKFIAQGKIPTYRSEFTRFKDMPSEHTTIFLEDPSFNLIEFKTYKNERMI